MSELNYVPSWLDSAMSLLEKLNKCIEKIETIVNTVVSVTKTANDALNLANTNEADITELQGKTTTLETNVTNVTNKADEALTKSNTKATNITALQNEKSPKLYLHEITLKTTDSARFEIKFWTINEESMSYRAKFASEVAFDAQLRPLNAILLSKQEQSTNCLTLQISEISLNHRKDGTIWNPQNCNGAIWFAAYLDDNNQIVTITDRPEWYGATISNDYVTIL